MTERNGLVPEVRVNRNGVPVRRWVRPSGPASASRSGLASRPPAPAAAERIAPLSRSEITDLIEAVRMNMGARRFDATTARTLSRLASLAPRLFRSIAGLAAAPCNSSDITWSNFLSSGAGELYGDEEFLAYAARYEAIYGTMARLDPHRTVQPRAGILAERSGIEDPQLAAAEAFRIWVQSDRTQRSAYGVPAAPAGDLEFIAGNLDALIGHAPYLRERRSADRALMEELLAAPTPSLSGGIL